MRPLIVPLLPTGDAHERIARPVHVDGQHEHFGWNDKPGVTRAVNVGDALAGEPQSRRLLYVSNFACVETRADIVGGTLDPEKAVTTGRIEPGETRVMVKALANGIAAARPGLVLFNVETGTEALCNWMVANARSLAQRRRIPDGRIGCALANAYVNPDFAYGTPNINALFAVCAEYASGIVARLLHELVRPLAGLCTIAWSLGEHHGGTHPWVLPSPPGAPIPPHVMPSENDVNSPQVYMPNTATGQLVEGGVLDRFPKWAAFLVALDCIRANVAVKRKLAPILPSPSTACLNRAQLEVAYGHVFRSCGAQTRVPLWNGDPDARGEVSWVADACTRACAGTNAEARCGEKIDYAAEEVVSGNLSTKREAFEALKG